MLARILIDVCWIEESVKVDVRLLMFSYRVQSICLPKVSISFKGDIRPPYDVQKRLLAGLLREMARGATYHQRNFLLFGTSS